MIEVTAQADEAGIGRREGGLMPGFPRRVVLGRSGLQVGPLAVAGGYGVGVRALLGAFDRGVNVFYHGSRRSAGMTAAIRDLVAGGHRDELVVELQSYARLGVMLERSLVRGLRTLGLDHADVLLLGWFNGPPPERVMERAERLRERGAVRHLAISGHDRPAFVGFAADSRIDILHIRYNAAHTGAERDVFPLLPPEGRPGTVAYTATRWGSLLKARRMPPGEAPLRGRDCYRFVLSNPDLDVCMCGPKDDAEMTEALAALTDGPLSAEEAARVRRVGEWVHAHARMGR
ncbi:MAG: aldo/keto reductase [Acidobacteriota bacterium]